MTAQNPQDLRVMILINGLGAGGAERSTAEMLPHLVQAGITPIVVCLMHRPEGVERSVIDAGFDVRFIDATSYVGRVRSVRRLLEEARPEVLHTLHFEADVVGRLAAIGLPVAVMTSVVNTSYDAVRLHDPRVRRWKLRTVQLLDGWSTRHLAHHVHAITHAVKSSAVTALRLAEDDVTVVERGRDTTRIGLPSEERRRAARRDLGFSESDELVLNVARQEYQKGQEYLLEAAASLAKRRPNIHVLIAGRSGNATGDLERTARRLALRDRVRFLGHREDVPELLAAADVFVFPSLYEGLGGALLEAMAMKVPVVASDVPALREVLDDGRGGVLVPPGSSGDLREAIERLLDQPDLATKYGEAGHEIFSGRFTLERSVAGMAALYRQVAATRTGSSVPSQD